MEAAPSPARPPLRVGVIQSNYLPWKGYFDVIADVDLFVLYDDVPYSKNSWRNRNRIKTAKGLEWITVPVSAGLSTLICDVTLPTDAWQRKHLATLRQHYGRAPHWKWVEPLLDEAYGRPWTHLSALNQHLIGRIARDYLGLSARLVDSREYPVAGAKQDRLLALLRACGATHYLSGPAAQDYIDPAAFEAAGIALEWKSYAGYPEYPQFHPPFEHAVTILDLLFHAGPEAARYLRAGAAP